jgi:ribonucleotide reductase beta subunit family protein with ferritin-like domain
MNEITIPEAKIAYAYQMMMENVHSEAYALMLDNLIKDTSEKMFLFNAIHTIPSIKKISDWAIKWIETDTHIGNRLVAFACIEGIFFSGAFATIFWLKNYKNSSKLFMPGLIKSNEFISRDEGMHTDFACELFNLIINKPDKQVTIDIITDSVDIAQDFINESIKCKLIGLNADLMNQYIKYVADRLVVSLGYDKIYNCQNPFTFMNSIGMIQKTNFHESRPTEYQSAYTNNDNKDLTFLMLSEF